MNNKILLLDERVAQKIAAGEVIERPASIIKELVENSIDAGASFITVEIKRGGKEYIRISDNGCGIAEDDLQLAFKRHATSKLQSMDDFDTLDSMGFRGEALYSIAAVSKVDMLTKTANSVSGNRMIVCGGDTTEFSAAGCPDGTTIVIEDLFYNTPTRKKFLSKDETETQYISLIVQNLILSYPTISIKFLSNEKLIYQSRGDGSQRSAIFTIFGKEMVDNLFEFDGGYGGIHVFGYLGGKNIYRSSRSHQYLFLNHRPIRDSIITGIIENAYSQVLMRGRYPFYIANVNIDPKNIDVNVHPQKQTVKFSDINTVKIAVANAISSAVGMMASAPVSFDLNTIMPKENRISDAAYHMTQPSKPVQSIKSHDYKTILRDRVQQTQSNLLKQPPIGTIRPKSVENVGFELDDDFNIIGVAFTTYIILEKGEILYIIDQHAAHERLLYERYIEQYKRSNIESQMMLVPDIIELSYDDKLLLDEYINCIKEMGFDIDGYGGNSYIIRSIPAVLDKINLTSYMVSVAAILSSGGVPEEITSRLITNACKAAVKGGERLSKEEVAQLVKYIQAEDVPLSCPHGRPFVVKMDKRHIDKMFGRIV